MSDPSAGAAPDPRPRPQFGEYATPEEQRARIQEPAPWQIAPVAPPEPVAAGVPTPGIPAAPPVGVARPRAVDRIVTFALLAYGLVNVVSSIPAFLDYGAYAETMLAIVGVDVKMSDPGAGRGWGIAAVIVLSLGWLATAAVSVWNMRRGRLSWWIPLTAGILFTAIAGMLMAVPLVNDPAVWQALVASAGG